MSNGKKLLVFAKVLSTNEVDDQIHKTEESSSWIDDEFGNSILKVIDNCTLAFCNDPFWMDFSKKNQNELLLTSDQSPAKSFDKICESPVKVQGKSRRNSVTPSKSTPPSGKKARRKIQNYSFDHVFDQDLSSDKIFEAIGIQAIDELWCGRNCTILSHGSNGIVVILSNVLTICSKNTNTLWRWF